MAKITITYNGYRFTDTGHTWFERKAKFESDLPQNPAYRSLTTYTVKQTFLEPSFSDNQARYAALLAALKTTRATLTILDENGTSIFSGQATVQTNDLPAQWGQTLTEVTLSFLVVETLGPALSGNDASFSSDTVGPVALANVVSFKENVKADRFSPLVPNRRETQGTVVLAGKIYSAEPDPAKARDGLLAIQAQIEACIDSPEGTLSYGAFSQVVKIEAAAADLTDGVSILEWSVTGSYLRFPAGDYVEVEYTFDQKDELEKAERLTNVKGTIRASEETSARAKVAELSTGFAQTNGRVLKGQDISVRRLDGQDSGGGGTFVELTFTLELREPLAGTASFTLTSTDRRDVRSGVIRTTLAGKAYGATSAAALAAARAAGGQKYPIQTDASEVVETADIRGADYFVMVSFSYEYLRRGTWQYAEVTSATEVQTVGNGTQAISGVAMAANAATALALARSFMLPASSAFILSNRETQEDLHQSDFTVTPGDGSQGGDPASQHVKVDFAYNYFVPGPTGGALQYSTRTSEDYNTRDLTTDVSGTCYADSAGTADALIEAVWTELLVPAGTRKVKKEKTVQNQKVGTRVIFTGTSFALAVAAPLAANGDDLLEGTSSVETIYSEQKTVMTPIPYGTPFVQTNLGLSAGSQTVSGSVTALTVATAKAWARAKRPTTGYPEPVRETLHTTYYPLSGTLIRAYKWDFTYRVAFASLALS